MGGDPVISEQRSEIVYTYIESTINIIMEMSRYSYIYWAAFISNVVCMAATHYKDTLHLVISLVSDSLTLQMLWLQVVATSW